MKSAMGGFGKALGKNAEWGVGFQANPLQMQAARRYALIYQLRWQLIEWRPQNA